MAYEILKRLKKGERHEILRKLASDLSASSKARGQKHKVFRPSSDIKEITSQKFIDQKIGYIHANPISGKWRLAESMEVYPHSSAVFYSLGKEHRAPLVHVNELMSRELE